ncbi:CDP-Glycerol:Poly(glycerophosphate) glycerophosphotransferase [Natronincola peptidivorans]|uniref:CDP-Glycerol:Poly(Glycerophosphate) glycerophosphotransferase n=1 Tax=Natronincola peptidivorans TaxID=426128 RepID=A0A1I0CPI1_9FIRM|nr:CDP-glycerol glycerophosphotransferase family protein [Natronincola peptidivorans]SET21559.1 CDP-Glycerol:Poly(glycerophosphate) glycerophosphotransferase [Natronincola peptidivorans]
MSVITGIKLLIEELKSKKKFFSKDNKRNREVVFYSESKIYYLYYEGLIKTILEKSDLSISYITSDPNDPVFEQQTERFKVFFINKLLAFTTPFIDSKVFILTMPDIEQFHIKRSINDVNHIYVFHAVVSAHMMYRKGAFDHYDTIFCVGPHHIEEIRQTEKVYNLERKKELVEVGYPWIEKVHERYENYKLSHSLNNNEKIILIAPSWHEQNIIETCGEDVIKLLLEKKYQVVLRPHPEIIKRNYNRVQQLINLFGNDKNFQMELNLTSDENFYKADLLITDWSGIAYEYAWGTERPVVFINTPKKVNNQDYQELKLEPLEIKARKEIGIEVQLDDIHEIDQYVEELISNKSKYVENIVRDREKYIFNWGNASEVGADYIIDYCKNKL